MFTDKVEGHRMGNLRGQCRTKHKTAQTLTHHSLTLNTNYMILLDAVDLYWGVLWWTFGGIWAGGAGIFVGLWRDLI